MERWCVWSLFSHRQLSWSAHNLMNGGRAVKTKCYFFKEQFSEWIKSWKVKKGPTTPAKFSSIDQLQHRSALNIVTHLDIWIIPWVTTHSFYYYFPSHGASLWDVKWFILSCICTFLPCIYNFKSPSFYALFFTSSAVMLMHKEACKWVSRGAQAAEFQEQQKQER